MFMPPIERCRVIGAYVRLDQCFAECRAEHGCCEAEVQCPLRVLFQDSPYDDEPSRERSASEWAEHLDLML